MHLAPMWREDLVRSWIAFQRLAPDLVWLPPAAAHLSFDSLYQRRGQPSRVVPENYVQVPIDGATRMNPFNQLFLVRRASPRPRCLLLYPHRQR